MKACRMYLLIISIFFFSANSLADSYLLLSFDVDQSKHTPNWVAIKSGWSRLPIVDSDQSTHHYEIVENPQLIKLKPGKYQLVHIDLGNHKHKNPKLVQELDYFPIKLRKGSVLYNGDIKLHKRKLGFAFSRPAISKACDLYQIVQQLPLVVELPKQEPARIDDPCSGD